MKPTPRNSSEVRENWRSVNWVLKSCVEFPLDEVGLDLLGVQNGAPDTCVSYLLIHFFIHTLTTHSLEEVFKYEFEFDVPQKLARFLQSNALKGLLEKNGLAVEGLQTPSVPRVQSEEPVLSSENSSDEADRSVEIKELELKIDLLQRQVTFVEMQRKLEQSQHESALEEKAREYEAMVQYRKREAQREQNTLKVLNSQAKLKLCEEFEAKIRQIEESASHLPSNDFSDDPLSEEDTLLELAQLRTRYAAQCGLVEALEHSKTELSDQCKELQADLEQERQVVDGMVNKLFENAQGEHKWVNDLRPEAKAAANRLIVNMEALQNKLKVNEAQDGAAKQQAELERIATPSCA